MVTNDQLAALEQRIDRLEKMLARSNNTTHVLGSQQYIPAKRLQPGDIVNVSMLPDKVCLVDYVDDISVGTHNVTIQLREGGQITDDFNEPWPLLFRPESTGEAWSSYRADHLNASLNIVWDHTEQAIESMSINGDDVTIKLAETGKVLQMKGDYIFAARYRHVNYWIYIENGVVMDHDENWTPAESNHWVGPFTTQTMAEDWRRMHYKMCNLCGIRVARRAASTFEERAPNYFCTECSPGKPTKVFNPDASAIRLAWINETLEHQHSVPPMTADELHALNCAGPFLYDGHIVTDITFVAPNTDVCYLTIKQRNSPSYIIDVLPTARLWRVHDLHALICTDDESTTIAKDMMEQIPIWAVKHLKEAPKHILKTLCDYKLMEEVDSKNLAPSLLGEAFLNVFG